MLHKKKRFENRSFLLVNAYLFLISALALEFYNAVFECEERIVSADAYVVARVNFRAALAHENAAREYALSVLTLDTEAFRFAVAAVVGGTGTLFMSE